MPGFRRRSTLAVTLITWFAALTCSNAIAASAEQARRLHDRLTGVPPDPSTAAAMIEALDDGRPLDAAYLAMESPEFYDIRLVQLAAPWTNRDFTPFVELNDFIATVVGFVRDDRDFRGILSDNLMYEGRSDLGLPAFSTTSNGHYAALAASGVSLKDALVAVPQSDRNGLPAEAAAGVLTSRAASRAFYIDGTNRAMLRFTLINFLCRDLEQVADTTLPPDLIRQDVSRSPGGDSRLFLNNCIGCHSGMDPLAQAFAYYDFAYDDDADPEAANGQLVYNGPGAVDPVTGTRVQSKYFNNNTTFAPGFITPDNRWENRWRKGRNQLLGWDESLDGRGTGAASMGEELAHSQAFAQCQAQHAFEAVCLRAPVDAADRSALDAATAAFQSRYNLRDAFASAAVYCMGD